MKDFYDKRRHGKEPNCQPEILPAASSKEGVSQQARRFKNGPHGLQEVAKKRKRQASTTHKNESSLPLHEACIDTVGIAQASSPPDFLFAQADGGENESFTFSGNSEGQSIGGSRGLRPVESDASDLGCRSQSIGSDPLASALGAGDPFDTLPLSNFPRAQILIYHGQ
jgi:hypothetical protein